MWLLSKNLFVRALPLFLAGVEGRKKNQITKGIERYNADDIDFFCDSIESCKELNQPGSANRNKCDGRVITEVSGTISYKNYDDQAACRWEVHAPEGARIKVKIHSGSSFGIEHQDFCGNDKLSLGYDSDAGSKKLFGRICSSRKNSQTPFNGLDAMYSPNGQKIQSKKFREGTILDTNRLIIHFQSDRSDTGAGFSMEYEMVDLPKEKPIIEVGDDLEADLHGVIQALAPQIADNHEQKLRERLTKLFKRFDSRMEKCNKTQKMHDVILQVSHEDIDKTKDLWMNFFRNAFNQCDIPIINNNEDRFDGTSWPHRIASWFERLKRKLAKAKAKEERLQKKGQV